MKFYKLHGYIYKVQDNKVYQRTKHNPTWMVVLTPSGRPMSSAVLDNGFTPEISEGDLMLELM